MLVVMMDYVHMNFIMNYALETLEFSELRQSYRKVKKDAYYLYMYGTSKYQVNSKLFN